MSFPLRFQGEAHGLTDVTVARVTTDPLDENGLLVALPSGAHTQANPRLVRALLTTEPLDPRLPSGVPTVALGPSDLSHIDVGDVLAVHPGGRVDTLFKHSSPDNALFVTDRCNSNCLMCSQPPKDRDDFAYHYRLNSELIPLLPKDTPVLGMTGGEPTLLGWRLLRLLRQLAEELPDTEIQILSNGRVFAWAAAARAVAEAIGSPTIFSIPLYADNSWQHDYVVQSRGAFVQTVLGLHNLARSNVRAEVRVVLHMQTVGRLGQLARFIHRNLPFVEHVALMGLEHTGYTRFNDAVLWMEPTSYHETLREAVSYLSGFGMAVSLYNLPLCLLPEDLWWCARSSISDWKREYHQECLSCDVRGECGGLFATSSRQSEFIRSVRHG